MVTADTMVGVEGLGQLAEPVVAGVGGDDRPHYLEHGSCVGDGGGLGLAVEGPDEVGDGLAVAAVRGQAACTPVAVSAQLPRADLLVA